MKTVKITYHCDYCKQTINTDDDSVCVLLPGRIGYQDSLNMQPEDDAQHYHDTCMEYLLCLTASNDKNLGPKEKKIVAAKVPEPEVITDLEPPRAEKQKKDLPALQAFIDAGRTQRWCAIEFGVVDSTIHYWLKEIMEMKKEGTWEAYCEERRAK